MCLGLHKFVHAVIHIRGPFRIAFDPQLVGLLDLPVLVGVILHRHVAVFFLHNNVARAIQRIGIFRRLCEFYRTGARRAVLAGQGGKIGKERLSLRRGPFLCKDCDFHLFILHNLIYFTGFAPL